MADKDQTKKGMGMADEFVGKVTGDKELEEKGKKEQEDIDKEADD